MCFEGKRISCVTTKAYYPNGRLIIEGFRQKKNRKLTFKEPSTLRYL